MWFDIGYALIGSVVAFGVWAQFGAVPAVLIAGLMVLCYFAGSVKYRHR